MVKNQFDRSFEISKNPKMYQTSLALHCHLFYQASLLGTNHSHQSHHYWTNDQRLEHARSPNSATSLNESQPFSEYHVPQVHHAPQLKSSLHKRCHSEKQHVPEKSHQYS